MNDLIDDDLLDYLVKIEQIKAVSQDTKKMLIKKEKNSLNRLRKQNLNTDKELYLNSYDRLFRHISLLILKHNYELTNNSPHQTLAKISELFCDKNSVSLMIQQRHKLKKNQSDLVSEKQVKTLQQLLAHFDNSDVQVFNIES